MTFRSILPCLFLFSQLSAQDIPLTQWGFQQAGSEQDRAVTLPHTWNNEDAFDDEPGYFRGKGSYRTSFEGKTGQGKVYLHFKGANQRTEVFLNEHSAGTHTGGYTAFDIDITELVRAGKNEVGVEMDNSHDEAVPPLDADFTFFGGLYRGASLHYEHSLHFNRKYGADEVYVEPVLSEDGEGSIAITAGVSKQSTSRQARLRSSIYDREGKLVTVKNSSLQAGSTEIRVQIPISQPRAWSPGDPYLYNLRLELYDQDGTRTDHYEQKLGFRTVEATPTGFLLNGAPLKLIGVNRHQDLPGMGNAVPPDLQVEDLVRIKDMGSNFLRLAHYPQDKAIYKAADSLGLILWSEVPVINKVPPGDAYAAYEKHSMDMQRAHIYQNRNHPSLVFIGYMNEIFLRMVFDKPTDAVRAQTIERTLELARKLEDLTRELAPRHITVMALHGNPVYNETGIAAIPMVIGWNLYYGWYLGKIDDLGGFLDEQHRRYPSRPLIISEYGVGADDRIHSRQPEKYDFSEEYQLLYHQGYLRQVLERPFVIGMTAWNYADFSSEFRGDAMPHINQKGLVNYDRSPKNVYYWYRAMLKPGEPQLRIFRDYPVHLDNDPERDIMVLANGEVELELNGESLGKQLPKEGVVHYRAQLQPGENTIRAIAGTEEDLVTLSWKQPRIEAVGDTLALNLGAAFHYRDASGQVWMPAGPGSELLRLLGKPKARKTASNITGTQDDPIFQHSLEQLEEISLPLTAGRYLVTLFWADPDKEKASAYELGRKVGASDQEQGGLSLSINNGQPLSFSTMKSRAAQEISADVQVEEEGLLIRGTGGEKFSLAGIRLIRLE